MHHRQCRWSRKPWSAAASLVTAVALLSLGMVAGPAASAAAETLVTTPHGLAQAFASASDEEDAVVLGSDITLDADDPAVAVPRGEELTLDLHGHDLRTTGARKHAGVLVPETGTLVVDDTTGGGALVADSTHGNTLGAGAGTEGSSALASSGTLTIRAQTTLQIRSGATVTNTGTLVTAGAIVGNGRVVNEGAIRNNGTVADGLTVTGQSYLLTFDANGGSQAPKDLRVYAETLAGTGLDLPPQKPTRDGYTFTGWYLDSDTAGDPVTVDTTLSTDDRSTTVTMYAGWEAQQPATTKPTHNQENRQPETKTPASPRRNTSATRDH
ncbi:MAG: InlB B-repeat-containing protein, partial [Nocardioidaceae bacterium]